MIDNAVPAGYTVVIILATDNVKTVNTTESDTHEVVYTQHSGGVTNFTKVGEVTKSSGAAADGVTTSGWIGTLVYDLAETDSIVFGFDASITAKAATAYAFKGSTLDQLVLVKNAPGFDKYFNSSTGNVGGNPATLPFFSTTDKAYRVDIRGTGGEGDSATETTPGFFEFPQLDNKTTGGAVDTNIAAYGGFRISQDISVGSSAPDHSACGLEHASISFVLVALPKRSVEWFRLTDSAFADGEITDCSTTYISQPTAGGENSTNYGNAGTILISDDNRGASTKRHGLVRFRFPASKEGADMEIEEATLFLQSLKTNGVSDGATKHMAYRIIDTQWVEGTSNGDGATWDTYDGLETWGNGGDDNANRSLGYTIFNPKINRWVFIDFVTVISSEGIVADRNMSLLLRWSAEGTTTHTAVLGSRRILGSSDAIAYPPGAPGGWSPSAKPVLRVVYREPTPSPVEGVSVGPDGVYPDRAKFSWEPPKADPAAARFWKYLFRYKSSTGVTPLDPAVNLDRYGTSGITVQSVKEATMAAAATFLENTLYSAILFLETKHLHDENATPSFEVTYIRPDVPPIDVSGGGGFNIPRLLNYNDLDGTTHFVQDKMVFAAAGIGERAAGTLAGFDRKMQIWVDWGDGFSDRFTPFVTKVTTITAAASTVIPVDDPTGLEVGDPVILVETDASEADVGRITAKTATSITINTDRAGGDTEYGYSAGSLVYTLPTHVYTKAATYTPKVRVLNGQGFASDSTAAVVSSVIGVRVPVAVLTSNLQSAYIQTASPVIAADTIHFSGTDSYPRMADKPITLWNFTGTAGTHTGAAATSGDIAVSYFDHVHDTAGAHSGWSTTACTFDLVVKDGTNNSTADSITVDITSRQILNLFTGLIDGYETRSITARTSTEIQEGIDVREFFVVGDGKSLLMVSYTGPAVTDTDADGNPDDMETLITAYNGRKIITDTLPTGSTTATYVGHFVGDLEWTQIGAGQYSYSFKVVYEVFQA